MCCAILGMDRPAGQQVGLIDVLRYRLRTLPKELCMIDVHEAMRAVLQYRDGDLVVPTEMAVSAWADVTDDPSLDLPVSAMSKGSSVGLGLALACPDRRVVVWDGDGGLLMNLGSLVTVAGQAPRNLYHIVLDNGMYATTGGQPVPNVGGFSFKALAEAAGYPRAYEFDDLEEWSVSIGQILQEDGPVMIVAKSAPLFPDWSAPRRRKLRSSPQIAREAIARAQ